MYKRPAHILFVGSAEIPVRLPCELLRELDGQFLQGRCLELGELVLASEAIVWADLLVALDDAAYEFMTHKATALPIRRWSLPTEDAACRAYIWDSLNSMAAGMRMMQRQRG